jgi:hypothetical protein
MKTDFYTTWKNQNKASMFSYIDEKDHAAERRLVATAYSLTSLLQLEPFVNQLIVQFLARLAEFSDSKTPSTWCSGYMPSPLTSWANSGSAKHLDSLQAARM